MHNLIRVVHLAIYYLLSAEYAKDRYCGCVADEDCSFDSVCETHFAPVEVQCHGREQYGTTFRNAKWYTFNAALRRADPVVGGSAAGSSGGVDEDAREFFHFVFLKFERHATASLVHVVDMFAQKVLQIPLETREPGNRRIDQCYESSEGCTRREKGDRHPNDPKVVRINGGPRGEEDSLEDYSGCADMFRTDGGQGPAFPATTTGNACATLWVSSFTSRPYMGIDGAFADCADFKPSDTRPVPAELFHRLWPSDFLGEHRTETLWAGQITPHAALAAGCAPTITIRKEQSWKSFMCSKTQMETALRNVVSQQNIVVKNEVKVWVKVGSKLLDKSLDGIDNDCQKEMVCRIKRDFSPAAALHDHAREEAVHESWKEAWLRKFFDDYWALLMEPVLDARVPVAGIVYGDAIAGDSAIGMAMTSLPEGFFDVVAGAAPEEEDPPVASPLGRMVSVKTSSEREGREEADNPAWAVGTGIT